jgi:phage terminase large subunit GpA-like protein
MPAAAYLGNVNLKGQNTTIGFTEQQILELAKCKEDPCYFINNYVKIIHVDDGLIAFTMFDYQEKMVKNMHNNRFNIFKLPRQVGKTTVSVGYILHYIIFNANVRVALLANKGMTARTELLARLQQSFESLPQWMQQGIVSWNKGSLELENGSRVIAAATSSSAIRGGSYNIIFLDEFAHILDNVAEEFFTSVYPTISSGKTTKIIIVSTPKGMNLFYKLWNDAETKRNRFVPFTIDWRDRPGYDEAWYEETMANMDENRFQQEFESFCTDTYIDVYDTVSRKFTQMKIGDLYDAL